MGGKCYDFRGGMTFDGRDDAGGVVSVFGVGSTVGHFTASVVDKSVILVDILQYGDSIREVRRRIED